MIAELGGGNVPAIGFAAGIERLILLMDNTSVAYPKEQLPRIYVAGMDENTRAKAFEIVNGLRLNGICAECDHMGRSLKAQFKYADKLDAEYVAVIGSDELLKGACTLKKMADGTQTEVAFADILPYLNDNK